MADSLSGAEIAFDKYALLKWISDESGFETDRGHILNCLKVAMSELTDNERAYIELYAEGKTVTQIAKILGVDRSTASRQIRRGLNYIYDHVRFASPRLLHSNMNFKKVR